MQKIVSVTARSVSPPDTAIDYLSYAVFFLSPAWLRSVPHPMPCQASRSRAQLHARLADRPVPRLAHLMCVNNAAQSRLMQRCHCMHPSCHIVALSNVCEWCAQILVYDTVEHTVRCSCLER